MRMWQCLAVNEMSRYGESSTIIASNVGLPVSVVESIISGYKLADTMFLQYEKDVNRCPRCGRRVRTGCFTCYGEEHPDKISEVIERPNTHKGFMLNVSLYKET